MQKEKDRIIALYGDFNNIMRSFCPSSYTFLSLKEAYQGKAPTLTYLDLTYGKGSAVMWVVMWISHIYAACGFYDTITDNMKIATSRAIAQECYFLNLDELICFFNSFIAGKYKTFYNNPSPQVITSSIQQFLKEREQTIAYLADKDEEVKVDEVIPFTEWHKEKLTKGEEPTIQYDNTKDVPIEVTQKYKLANMIFYNKGNCDFENLSLLRDSFIEKYNEDPYVYYKKILNDTK